MWCKKIELISFETSYSKHPSSCNVTVFLLLLFWLHLRISEDSISLTCYLENIRCHGILTKVVFISYLNDVSLVLCTVRTYSLDFCFSYCKQPTFFLFYLFFILFTYPCVFFFRAETSSTTTDLCNSSRELFSHR